MYTKAFACGILLIPSPSRPHIYCKCVIVCCCAQRQCPVHAGSIPPHALPPKSPTPKMNANLAYLFIFCNSQCLLGCTCPQQHQSDFITPTAKGILTGAIQLTANITRLIDLLESVAVVKGLFVMPFQDFLLQCPDQCIVGRGAVDKQLVTVRWRVQLASLQHISCRTLHNIKTTLLFIRK